jgi:ribosomal protein L32
MADLIAPLSERIISYLLLVRVAGIVVPAGKIINLKKRARLSAIRVAISMPITVKKNCGGVTLVRK